MVDFLMCKPIALKSGSQHQRTSKRRHVHTCLAWSFIKYFCLSVSSMSALGNGWDGTNHWFSPHNFIFRTKMFTDGNISLLDNLLSRVLKDFRHEVAKLRYSHNKHKILFLSSQTFSRDLISNNAQIFLNDRWINIPKLKEFIQRKNPPVFRSSKKRRRHLMNLPVDWAAQDLASI